MNFRLGDLACVVLLAALLLVSGLSRDCDGIDLGDEGWLAYGAVGVLSIEVGGALLDPVEEGGGVERGGAFAGFLDQSHDRRSAST